METSYTRPDDQRANEQSEQNEIVSYKDLNLDPFEKDIYRKTDLNYSDIGYPHSEYLISGC